MGRIKYKFKVRGLSKHQKAAVAELQEIHFKLGGRINPDRWRNHVDPLAAFPQISDWSFLPPELRYLLQGIDNLLQQPGPALSSLSAGSEPSALSVPPSQIAPVSTAETASTPVGGENRRDSEFDDVGPARSSPPSSPDEAGTAASMELDRHSPPSFVEDDGIFVAREEDHIGEGFICLTEYVSMVEWSLPESLPLLHMMDNFSHCASVSASIFVLPGGVHASETSGSRLDFSTVHHVLCVQQDQSNQSDPAFASVCSCCKDVGVDVSMLSLLQEGSHERIDLAARHGEVDVTKMCEHARAVLQLCARSLDVTGDWWDDRAKVHDLLSAAACASDRVATESWEWLTLPVTDTDQISKDAARCRRLPFKCSTGVYEVDLGEERLQRRHRTQARPHPSSIVTVAGESGSSYTKVSCASCARHQQTCECIRILRECLDLEKVTKELSSDIRVHENGRSLQIRGYSQTPIRPEPHPEVLRLELCKAGTNGTGEDDGSAFAGTSRSVSLPDTITASCGWPYPCLLSGVFCSWRITLVSLLCLSLVPAVDCRVGSQGEECDIELWSDPRPGEGWSPHKVAAKALVLDHGSCKLVTLSQWSRGESIQRFDGHTHGVINANNRVLFTFDFLHQFARQSLSCGLAFSGYLSANVDSWLRYVCPASAELKARIDPELKTRIKDLALNDSHPSKNRHLQKLFLDSFFDWVSLQFQHEEFEPFKDFTCHCHDDCDGPLQVFFLYDNACNVLKYVLNREPASSREVIWLVDKLHWANHVCCSPLMDSGAWDALQGINTQIAEQKNRITKFLQRSSAYLSWGRYLTLQHYLFTWVNQYQKLVNTGAGGSLANAAGARILVGDGVSVSVRKAEHKVTRPWVVTETRRAGVNSGDRMMFPQQVHRKTLASLLEHHFRSGPLKPKLVEPLNQFMAFLRSDRPALGWIIKLTVLTHQPSQTETWCSLCAYLML